MDKESIFAEALSKHSPDERRQFLDSSCAGNEALRREMELLLAAHDDAGSFLNKTPEELVATVDSGELPGRDEDADAWQALLEASDDPESLGRLGPYDVIEELGRGGFGVVLRANDSKLKRVVAIKLLAPQLAVHATAVQRFLREARAAAAVNDNHVVAIHSIDDNARPPMIVMEYIDGQSLQQKIDETGALDVKSILRIGMQTARGLSAAHRQGLVHRDVKPANILLENGVERVKLTDFGLARAVDDIGITQTGQITGTPQYMSPEQAQGQRIDHRADLFSLGCVLYAMCTGRAAFRADSAVAVMHRIVHDEPRPIRELNEDMPLWLCEIVDKLLAKQPDDRFQSAEELAELLNGHLAHLQQPDQNPQPAAVAKVAANSTAEAATEGSSESDVVEPVGLTSQISHWCTRQRDRRWQWAAVGTVVMLAALVVLFVPGIRDGVLDQWHRFHGRGKVTLVLKNPDTKIMLQGGDGVVSIREDSAVLYLEPGQYDFEWIGKWPDGTDFKSKFSYPVGKVALVNKIPAMADVVEVRRGGNDGMVSSRIPSSPPSTAQSVSAPQTLPFVRLADTWAEKGDRAPVVCLDVSPDGKHVVSGHKPAAGQAEGNVWLWEITQNLNVETGHARSGQKLLVGVNLTDMRFSPDSRFFAWTQDDGRLRRLLTDLGNTNADSFLPVESPLYCLDWSPDGKQIVTGGKGKLYFWDAAAAWSNNQKTEPIRVVDAHDGKSVRAVGWSPDGKWITTGSSDGKVYWWDLSRDPLESEFRNDSGHQNAAVTSMRWSPDSSRVLIGLSNGNVQAFQADGLGSSERGYDGIPCLAVAWSPDGFRIADGEGNRDPFIKIVVDAYLRGPQATAPSGPKQVVLFEKDGGHSKPITALDFTPDGHYLVSGSEDGTIKWWEFAEPLAPVANPRPAIKPEFVDDPAAREFFRTFERTIQEEKSLSVLYDGLLTVQTPGADGQHSTEQFTYGGSYEVGRGGDEADSEYWDDRWSGSGARGVTVSGAPVDLDPVPYQFYIGPVTRCGFYIEALNQFIRERYKNPAWDDDNSQPYITAEGKKLWQARYAGVLHNRFMPRLFRVRFVDDRNENSARNLAYELRPSETITCDVRLWIENKSLAPMRRTLTFELDGSRYTFAERYSGYSTQEIPKPFYDNTLYDRLAEARLISGTLQRRQGEGWEPTEWILNDAVYRAKTKTRLWFLDAGVVELTAGSEFSIVGDSRVHLTLGRLTMQSGFRESIYFRYGDVPPIVEPVKDKGAVDDPEPAAADGEANTVDRSREIVVFDAASTGGQAIVTATPDRVYVDRGSMWVQYPQQPGKEKRKNLLLREGVEYLVIDGVFIPQEQATLPPVEWTTAGRVVWKLDLTDADAVAKILTAGELIELDGHPVLRSALGTVSNPQRGPVDVRLITLDLSKIKGLPTGGPLALRYRYFIKDSDEVYSDEVYDIVLPQSERWTTFTDGPYKPSEILKAIRWRHRSTEQPLHFDRVELVKIASPGVELLSGGDEAMPRWWDIAVPSIATGSSNTAD